MKAFDNSAFEAAREQYEAEARERWGQTAAYQEHAEKTKGYAKEKWNALTEEMGAIFQEFARCMNCGVAEDAPEAQALVKKLQDHITRNYYTCTKPILAGLGQMYVADERFCNNIDQCGAGTADYASRAISAYCK